MSAGTRRTSEEVNSSTRYPIYDRKYAVAKTGSGQFPSVMIFIFMIGCWMFYFAFDTWSEKTLVCHSARSICMLSKLLSDLTGVELNKVTAQIWAALGLTVFLILGLVLHDRHKKEKADGMQVQRMK
jgi:hypothetical protein